MTRANLRKFHYIYKITRHDGKYYIGMHSTDNLDDGYFGSGQLLWKSIRKHGKEKHTKEITEFLPSREALKSRERELVNEEVLDDKLCMNLKLGGEGGWDHITPEQQQVGRLAGSSAGGKVGGKITVTQNQARGVITRLQSGKPYNTSGLWKQSEETKQRIGAANAIRGCGSGNSQYGTYWVCNEAGPIKIKVRELESFLQAGFVRGRKL